MGFTISQGKEQVEAAHRFQMNAEIRDVQLLDCSASTTQDQNALQDQLRLGLQMDAGILHVSEDEARFSVRITVFGDPKEDREDKEPHLFQVASRYAIVYSLRAGYKPAQPELDAFKDGNAIFHCWPYSRELVHNLTMRMGLPVPPMPFLRLAPKSGPKRATAKRLREVEAPSQAPPSADSGD